MSVLFHSNRSSDQFQHKRGIRLLTFVGMLSFVYPTHALAQTSKNLEASSGPSVAAQVFEGESTFDQSAGKTSQEILKQYELDPLAPWTTTQRQSNASRRSPTIDTWEDSIEIAGQDVQERQIALVNALREVTRKYLKWYLDNHDPKEIGKQGIDLVHAEHLDLTLLKFRFNREGPKPVTVVFDVAFHQQLRKRGRQLKLKEIGRFPTTLYISAGVFAALLFLYGTLKVLTARASKRDDYISSGRISMV